MVIPKQPTISVVMAVHNGARYLREAVASILNQTFRDYELIIINDGSTDESPEIIRSFADPRIMLIEREHHGLTRSLNEGLRTARGTFIARMDGDDLSLPKRFEQQLAFLNAHPNVGILGIARQLIDHRGRLLSSPPAAATPMKVRWSSLSKCPFAHPTVMMRRSLLTTYNLAYDENFQEAQDYELWTRILHHTDGANLQEPLFQQRLHDGSVTAKRRTEQLQNYVKTSVRTIQEYLPVLPITDQQVNEMSALFFDRGAALRTLGISPKVPAKTYLRILDAFVARYEGHPEIPSLRHEAMVRVARALLPHIFTPGSLSLLARLTATNPRLPLIVSADVWRMLNRRWRRLAVGHET